MKCRIIFTLIVLLSVANRACAQLSFGVDMGMNVSQLSMSKAVADTRNRQGYFLGPKVKATLPIVGLGADAAVRYTQKNAAFESWSDQVYVKEEMSYIEIPVNVLWEFSALKAFGFFLATGPQWNWYIGTSTWESEDNFRATFNHSMFSWNIGIGISVMDRVNLCLSRNIPIENQGTFVTKVYNTVSKQVEDAEMAMKNYGWQIALSFYF